MTLACTSIFILFLGAAFSHPLFGVELNPENAEAGDSLLRVKKGSKVDDSPITLSAAPMAGDDEMAGSTKKRSSVLLDLGNSNPSPAEASAVPADDRAQEKPSTAEGPNVEKTTQSEQSVVTSEPKLPEEPLNQSPSLGEPVGVPADSDKGDAPNSQGADQTQPQPQPQPQPNEKTDFFIAIDQPQEQDLKNMPVLISNPFIPYDMPKPRRINKIPSHRRPRPQAREKIVDDMGIIKGPVFAIGMEEPRMEGIPLPPQAILQMIAQTDGFVAPDPAPMREASDSYFQSPQQPQQIQGYGVPSQILMLRQVLKQQDEIKQVLSNVAQRQTSLQDALYRIETHFVLDQ